MMSKPLIFFASLLFLFSGSAILYFAVNRSGQAVESGGETITPAQLEAVLSNGEPITEFTLTERSGRSFQSTELDGEVCIVSFFFASRVAPAFRALTTGARAPRTRRQTRSWTRSLAPRTESPPI